MCSCDNTDTFTYDDQELLSQVRYGAGGSSTMTWDADQQRQKLTNSGGSTYFVYDPTAGVPAVLVETDGENETFYVREPGGELIARATGQTRQYYFFDRLGSAIAMVTAVEGNPTDRLFYTPWGELVTSGSRASTVGTTANPYRYVGELGYYYHHQDAGLADWMQLGVRFYQPEIGRFERRDPVAVDKSSPFAYADDQPTAKVDATGYFPWTTAIATCAKCGNCMRKAAGYASRVERGFRGHARDTGRDAPNAVKHCVWSCVGRKNCGLPCARAAVNAWELKPLLLGDDQDFVDSGMDLHNDDEGLGCGAAPGKRCEDCCKDKLRAGKLLHF